MELLLLKAYGSGYRGCLLDEDQYLFFQHSRRRGIRHLKRYPREDFQDTAHFMAMMQKFVTPPSFLNPPVPIKALVPEELDRVYRQLKNKASI